jgi:DNA-binding MarR family transcriptional regulator
MTDISASLKLIMNLSRAHLVTARRMEQRLSGHGLGFSDFSILMILNHAQGQKMRRGDLAEKIGLTASGVTRMLIPLEKIGLVQREAYERDARVSYVTLTETGKRVYQEALSSADLVSQDIIPQDTISVAKAKKMDALADILVELGGNII